MWARVLSLGHPFGTPQVFFKLKILVLFTFDVCRFTPDASTMISFVGDPFWLLRRMASTGRLILPHGRWWAD